ncbi:unnamed protein product [Rotaria sp. Silwood1]|nr:unnamed protein product [Rotaria sp. Silwood1]
MNSFSCLLHYLTSTMGGNQSQYRRRISHVQQYSYDGTTWGQRNHLQTHIGYGHNQYNIRQRLSFGAPPPRLRKRS